MCDRPNNDKFKKFHLRHYPHCNNCNLRVTKSTCVLDHIVRLAEGGPDTLANTQLLCLTCNALKTNVENLMDQCFKFEKQLQDTRSAMTHQQEVFESNNRKTKTERSKYNKYIKAIADFK